MRFTRFTFCMVLQALTGQISAQIDLGTAKSFGVVASTAITNTGATIVTGSLGLFPNTRSSITGFPPGISGTISAGNAVADQALQDAITAFNAAASLASTSQIAGADLGGQRLVAGTYTASSSVSITGTLTLDGQNNPNSLFVFQIGSTLTTATAASVVLVNGAQACNVFFQVGSSATLGTLTTFNGNILALTSISLLDGVSVRGGLYALNGAVTLINDQITPQTNCVAVPTGVSSTSSTPLPPVTSIDVPIIIPTTIQIVTPPAVPIDDVTTPLPPVTTAIPVQSTTVIIPDQPGNPDVPIIPDVPITISIPQIPEITSTLETPDIPVIPDVPITPTAPTNPNIPQIPRTTSTLETPDVPIIPSVPVTSTTPTNPNIPNISTTSRRSSQESSTRPDTSTITSRPQASTTSKFFSVPETSTESTRSSEKFSVSSKSLKTRLTSYESSSTMTMSTKTYSEKTTSTDRSQSSYSTKASKFSTSTMPLKSYSEKTTSTDRSQSSYPYKASKFSTSTMLTESYSGKTISTYQSQSSHLTKASKLSTSTMPTKIYSEKTTSADQSQYSYPSKAPKFSTSTISNGSKSKVYSVYVSTRVWNSTYPAYSNSKTYSHQVYTTSNATRTSSRPAETTMISGTPCTTLSYYEPSCACTQTTIVPISYTPGPSIESITTFESASVVTVSGLPCTTTQYYEPACDCIQTSTVPIRAVASTASICTVIDDVPYIASKYFEPACNCVQTATVPVRIASADEVTDTATAASCTETPNTLYMCIAACMQPDAPAITTSP